MAAAPSPVEVGARGTVASLMSQEIKYLRRLKLDHDDSSEHKQGKAIADHAASTGGGSRHKKLKKKKKVAGSGGFLPSICSAVEVTDTSKAEKIAGIGYRNLRTDAKKLAEE